LLLRFKVRATLSKRKLSILFWHSFRVEFLKSVHNKCLDISRHVSTKEHQDNGVYNVTIVLRRFQRRENFAPRCVIALAPRQQKIRQQGRGATLRNWNLTTCQPSFSSSHCCSAAIGTVFVWCHIFTWKHTMPDLHIFWFPNLFQQDWMEGSF